MPSLILPPVLLLFYFPIAVLSLSAALPTSARWKLLLNVGREQGTWMPSSWGESGARIALPVTVEFTSDQYNDGDIEPFLSRGGALRVNTVSNTSNFITEKGEQSVSVSGGGWTVEPPSLKDPAVLRFWLTVGPGCEKRDITLPTGKLFFSSACWMDEEIETAEKARASIIKLMEGEIKDNLDKARKEYDGANAIGKVGKLPSLVRATAARDNAVSKMNAVDRGMPKRNDKGLVPGKFPGVETRLRMAEGGMVVKREGKMGGIEYHIVGTWSCLPEEGS